MPGAAGFFCCAVLTCLSRGSACDKNTIAKIVARKKVSRATAFNRFMVILFLSLRQRLRILFSHTCRIAADAARFDVGARCCAGALEEGKQNLLRGEPRNPLFSQEKVTELLPAQCVDVRVPSAARTNHHSNGAELPSSAGENFWSSCRTSLWEKTKRLFFLAADFFQ